ncbi:MAG TPA: hypothetical protein VGC42_06120 [Kofleriaceae bacterium]
MFHRLHGEIERRMTGQHEERHTLVDPVQRPDQIEAVPVGQVVIDDRQIGRVLAKLVLPGLRRGGLVHRVAPRTQERGHRLPHIGVVVDDENRAPRGRHSISKYEQHGSGSITKASRLENDHSATPAGSPAIRSVHSLEEFSRPAVIRPHLAGQVHVGGR